MAEHEHEQDDAPLTEAELNEPIREEAAVSLAEAALARRPLELTEGSFFDSKGRATGVVMRPCISRGKRIRGLPPYYSPRMLGEHAAFSTGWPMFIDHAPAALREALEGVEEERILAALREAMVDAGLGRIATRVLEPLREGKGRSVRELGGQVLRPFFDPTYAREDDEEFGYLKGAVLAEYWATPFIRNTAGENPNLFHTSISAWPTSGKPGTVANRRCMEIAGIRSKPEGSWDYVVRGGAGGRLQAADESLMVSIAESMYAPRVVKIDLANTDAKTLRETLRKDFPQLAEEMKIDEEAPPAAPPPPSAGLSEADVTRMIREANDGRQDGLTEDEVRERVEEQADELLGEREEQRDLAALAHELIESAEGLGSTWKADLRRRWNFKRGEPTAAVLRVCESADEDDAEKTAEALLRKAVEADIDHCRELIAEATGRPRVRGEGGKPSDREKVREGKNAGKGGETPYWRERMAEMGVAKSPAKVVEALYGDDEDEDGED